MELADLSCLLPMPSGVSFWGLSLDVSSLHVFMGLWSWLFTIEIFRSNFAGSHDVGTQHDSGPGGSLPFTDDNVFVYRGRGMPVGCWMPNRIRKKGNKWNTSKGNGNKANKIWNMRIGDRWLTLTNTAEFQSQNRWILESDFETGFSPEYRHRVGCSYVGCPHKVER